MFHKMGGIGNTSDQPIQHKLYTFKNKMINEGISIIGISEVNSNWSKIPIKRIYIIGYMDGFKKVRLLQDIIELLLSTERFKMESQPSWRWMKYHSEQLK